MVVSVATGAADGASVAALWEAEEAALPLLERDQPDEDPRPASPATLSLESLAEPELQLALPEEDAEALAESAVVVSLAAETEPTTSESPTAPCEAEPADDDVSCVASGLVVAHRQIEGIHHKTDRDLWGMSGERTSADWVETSWELPPTLSPTLSPTTTTQSSARPTRMGFLRRCSCALSESMSSFSSYACAGDGNCTLALSEARAVLSSVYPSGAIAVVEGL